ncbi:hypothetical protein JHK87_052775 [Glycine soja]|nr:hypothetical protein JHK87_052775 [Glycine soja]
MMSKSLEEAIVIIDSIAASDYQSHHDRALTQRKDLVMDNKKRRPIISRTKPDLNKTFKEATKAIEVAQVQISLMAGDYKTLDNNEKKNKEGIEKENEINDEVVTSEKVEEDEDMAELVDYFIGGDWAPQP